MIPINTLSELYCHIESCYTDLYGILNSKNLINILNNYCGDDYKQYVYISNETYNRSIVRQNHNFEIIVITWNTNQKSDIHDHPQNGCLMKVLEGSLVENLYSDTLDHICSTNLDQKFISYIDNQKGYHQIVNYSDNISVSLHIYSPPNYISNKFNI